MTRKEEQAALLALVVWVLGWGLWALSLDTSITVADSVFGAACGLHRIVREGSWGQLGPWLHQADFHPPLPYLVAGLIAAPLGGGLFAVRMSMVLLHVVAVFQVHRLARTVTGDRPTAVLAALLTAVTPVIAGWFRLDYHEPITTVVVLATLQVAVTTDLHRQRRRALLLGLLVGLGALSKLSYPAVLLLPALLFLGTRIRTARAAINAGLALLICLALSSWWYVQHIDSIIQNWQMSTTSQSVGVSFKLLGYLVAPAGNAPLTLGAVAGIALAWRQRSVERGALGLLAFTWLLGYAAFLLIFDYGGRYILLLLPLSALFAAVAGIAALQRVPRRWRRASGIAVVAVIVALSVVATLSQDPSDRSAGLLSPDRTDRSAFRRGQELLATRSSPAIWAADTDEAYHVTRAHLGLEQIEARLPSISWIERAEAHGRVTDGGQVQAMIVTTQPGHGKRRGVWRIDAQDAWTWTASQRRVLIQRFGDETPFIVEVYLLGGKDGAPKKGARD
jgi:hypothetical protein